MSAEPSLFDCQHTVCVHHRKAYGRKGCEFEAAVERAERQLEQAKADLAAASPEPLTRGFADALALGIPVTFTAADAGEQER
jgi:hypothetical protein